MRLGNSDVIHDDVTCQRDVQGHLASDFGRAQSLHPFFQHEPSDILLIIFGPNHKNVSLRGMGYPHLVSIQHILVSLQPRSGLHGPGVRPIVGLSQSKASQELPFYQPRDIPLSDFFACEGGDREDDERVLDTQSGTIGAVDSIELSVNEPLRSMGYSGCTVLVQSTPQVAIVSQKSDHGPIEFFLPKVCLDPGHEMGLRELPGVVHNLGVKGFTMVYSSVSWVLSARGSVYWNFLKEAKYVKVLPSRI